MDLLYLLNKNYQINAAYINLLRDGGSASYAVYADNGKYFLRVVKPAFFDTSVKGIDVQLFLQDKNFPVPFVIKTKNNQPYVMTDGSLFVLYEFIDGSESNPEQDAEAVGELIGKLHNLMKNYTQKLIKHDKYFYIGRYIDILRKKQYPKVNEFVSYSEALWDKVGDLPRGYCHGDMYNGNVYKASDGRLYIIDFDTSCEGIPMYDITLFCNKTHYFDYDMEGHVKSREVLSRFLTGYLKHNSLYKNETNAFYDLIALYHFALQATIVEIYGIDCIDNDFLDKQLDWLYRWREQCME